MGRVSTCQKNCKTIDLRGAQVNDYSTKYITESVIRSLVTHYDVKSQSFNPGLQYPHLHGPVHTPDDNRWDTPPV